MKLPCSLCPYGTKKTDELKLVTIGGRDYLLCKSCLRYHTKGRKNYGEKSNGGIIVSGIPTVSGERGGDLQPAQDFVPN